MTLSASIELFLGSIRTIPRRRIEVALAEGRLAEVHDGEVNGERRAGAAQRCEVFSGRHRCGSCRGGVRIRV
jgi:hypothetical protein